MKFKRISAFTTALLMSFASISAVFAEEKPVMEISFDGKNYEAGDIATAEVIVYNTTYNVVGFSLEYGENVTPVDKDGLESDNAGALVSINEAMYRGEGIYSVLSTDVTDNSIRNVMYVNPSSTDEDVKEGSVSADSSGRKIATITFKMTQDGIPDVKFTTVEGDTEFGTTAFFMLDDGTQPAGSVSRVRYNPTEEEVKPDDNNSDNKKEENPQKDDKNDTPAPDNEPDKTEDEDINDENIIINTTVPDDDPTVTGQEGTDISDIVPEKTETPKDNAGDDIEEVSPLERSLGIVTIGIAFTVCGGVVLKKIMQGAKKED